MTLPSHILRRFVCSGGVRLAKRASIEPEQAGICPTCHQPVLRKKMLAVWQVDGICKNDIYFHYGCQPYTQIDPWYRRGDEDKIEMKGNLDPEEYRYWIGFRDEYSHWAMCRCCGKQVYSKEDRIKHFRDPDYLVGTNQCSTRLVLAYKKMLASQACAACKKPRFGKEKWGVPLCEQASCVNHWKFNQYAIYIRLKYELSEQAKRAGTDFPPEKQTIRVYCQMCRLYEDSVNHAEIHAAMIQSRNKGFLQQ